MSLTINENGKLLTETKEGVTMPFDYSFDVVNDFVHRLETDYEDLVSLCLGMSCYIERIKADTNRLKNK